MSYKKCVLVVLTFNGATRLSITTVNIINKMRHSALWQCYAECRKWCRYAECCYPVSWRSLNFSPSLKIFQKFQALLVGYSIWSEGITLCLSFKYYSQILDSAKILPKRDNVTSFAEESMTEEKSSNLTGLECFRWNCNSGKSQTWPPKLCDWRSLPIFAETIQVNLKQRLR